MNYQTWCEQAFKLEVDRSEGFATKDLMHKHYRNCSPKKYNCHLLTHFIPNMYDVLSDKKKTTLARIFMMLFHIVKTSFCISQKEEKSHTWGSVNGSSNFRVNHFFKQWNNVILNKTNKMVMDSELGSFIILQLWKSKQRLRKPPTVYNLH